MESLIEYDRFENLLFTVVYGGDNGKLMNR